MNKAASGITALLAVTALCLSGCGPTTAKMTSPSASVSPIKVSEAESSCLEYVQNKLSDGGGGIYTNNFGSTESDSLASCEEVLSESEGLMLCYYAASSNRIGFESVLGFIQNRLDSGQIIFYRLGQDGSPYKVNAAIDDLRILRGIIEGSEALMVPEYQELCLQYADRLYSTNVKNGLLYDFYDEEYEKAGKSCTLCYSDLKTMLLLSKSDERWLAVEKNMREMILNGYLGNDFPFFQTSFQPDSNTYHSEKINMIEALLTVLHLSEVGACPRQTVSWLEYTLLSGAIYGAYRKNGTPSVSFESTAIYSLCVLIGVSENNPTLAKEAVNGLLALRISDKSSGLYGAFADAGSGKAYSYDNLMALTALRAYDTYTRVH